MDAGFFYWLKVAQSHENADSGEESSVDSGRENPTRSGEVSECRKADGMATNVGQKLAELTDHGHLHGL